MAAADAAVPSGVSEDLRPFGFLEYWMQLRVPLPETHRLTAEQLKAVQVGAY